MKKIVKLVKLLLLGILMVCCIPFHFMALAVGIFCRCTASGFEDGWNVDDLIYEIQKKR